MYAFIHSPQAGESLSDESGDGEDGTEPVGDNDADAVVVDGGGGQTSKESEESGWVSVWTEGGGQAGRGDEHGGAVKLDALGSRPLIDDAPGSRTTMNDALESGPSMDGAGETEAERGDELTAERVEEVRRMEVLAQMQAQTQGGVMELASGSLGGGGGAEAHACAHSVAAGCDAVDSRTSGGAQAHACALGGAAAALRGGGGEGRDALDSRPSLDSKTSRDSKDKEGGK